MTTESTSFTRDILGRYICNSLDEALHSADRANRPDARPFDIIILGAGTIGAATAQHLLANDQTHSHRILVLEGGPFLLPAHLQNLPLSGLNIYGPPATSIADLRAQGQYGPDHPRDEVWGLPWHSPQPSPGLAYAIGGRSLAWGGWSPALLDDELEAWPTAVADDLKQRYFAEAAAQLGSDVTNDFIHGELHDAMRKVLAQGIQQGKVSGAIPLDQLPNMVEPAPHGQRDLFKLEAPLAVQSRARTGFFPLGKFSSIPLLMQASRDAFVSSNFDDVKKRLMVVPNVHINRLHTVQENGMQRVTAVDTNHGLIQVPPDGVVINAMGTIESTRLAQISFQGVPDYDEMGRNLMGDMLTFYLARFPREMLPVDDKLKDLQASALFVRGSHDHNDGSTGHFHLQITGAGLGPWDFNAESEMYRTVPDIDTLSMFRHADDTHVVMMIIGVAKMEPDNAKSYVRLDPEIDEYGQQRAYVNIEASDKDEELWSAMEQACMDVIDVLGQGQAQVFFSKRNGLGESHHEAGSLQMGDDPSRSATDANARMHGVTNAYVASPALFPTNAAPVLTGVALGRRLGDYLVPPPTPYVPDDGLQPLFDGVNLSTWLMAGNGGFGLVDGTLESVPGDDLGLYWCSIPMPADFVLKLDWLRWSHGDNSGILVRFPDPRSMGYQNEAYVASQFGFEVQIDERGLPDGAAYHRTGAIYGVTGQDLLPEPALPAGQWNEFEIRVQGQHYTVSLNGQQVSVFENQDPQRGLPTSGAAPSFIGLQAYPGSRVAFRNIRFGAL